MADKVTDNITVGSQVTVEIVKTPTNAAAVKTLVRVLSKSLEHAAEKKRSKVARARAVTVKTRGGRPWEHRAKIQTPVRAEIGDTGTVKATVDILNDLNSVGSFVKISAG